MTRNDSGKISTAAALTVFIIGVIAIVGAAVLLIVRPGAKDGTTVQADVVPFAARLDKLDGDIGIARQTNSPQDASQGEPYQGWTKATLNAPVSVGDRIYVRDGSKAAIAISRNNYVRLNPGTSLDVVSLTPANTQLALREGACVVDVGSLDSGETYEIATPNGAVDFTEPGLYQVGIDDGGDTVVSVLNGVAEVAGLAGTGQCSRGKLLTLAAEDTAEAIISDLSPDVAGTIVDDYYSYRYQNGYDGRYRDYHAYESDPNYYGQSYRRSVSYQYISQDVEIAGVEDLDSYGDWQDVSGYGHCWHPHETSSDWAPYRDGYWSDDSRLGLTWVSNERWGWAPYHYGRWAHVNQQWYWVPAEINRRTAYAPALVAFVSPRADEVGWVPLGPGDPYVPRYYDRDYHPRYEGSRSDVERYVNGGNYVNYRDPEAVTVVSINQFTQVITPRVLVRTDAATFVNARPIVDPYSVAVVRQIAPTIEASRPAIAVPLESQQSFNRPVIVRRQPVVPSSGANVAQALKVEPVPDQAVKQKMKVKNVGQPVATTQPNGIPAVPPEARVNTQTAQEREARINALASQAAQGNKAAKHEMRQLEVQQQQELKAQRKAAEQQAVAAQQQQAEQQKAQRRAEKQQAVAAQQQQAEQQKAQRRAEKQQAQQAAQQAEQQRQAQAAQQKAEKRAAKQQAKQQAQPAQQGQTQAAQQAEQQKAQRRAEKQQAAQQAAQQAQQQAQQAEQQKAQRRAEKQKAAQQAAQQAQQQAQQAEQQKAQRRAEKKQAAQQAAQQAARQQAQAQQSAQQSEQLKAQRRAEKQQAAQQAAQQQAARQQAQQEQKRIQKQAQQQAAEQAQQQAQQQRQQQKQQRRAEAQSTAPNTSQAGQTKAERKAEKAKNKNSNQ